MPNRQITRKQFIAMSSRAALAAPLLCFGCKATAPDQEPPWIEIASVIAQSSMAVGVATDLQAHPEHRVQYQLAESALTGMVDRQNWNAAAFADILRSLPVAQFQGPNGILMATTITMVFDPASGTWLAVESLPAVERAMRAVRDGLRAGLQSQPVMASKAMKPSKPISIRSNAPRVRI
jgi:hypothetical protein